MTSHHERSDDPVPARRAMPEVARDRRAGPEPVADVETCDVCGAAIKRQLNGLHCKIRCLNCGFTRDCSDP